MPLNSELFKLLSNTFKLDIPKEPPTKCPATIRNGLWRQLSTVVSVFPK
jgi:hypothetical protein